MGKSPIGQQSSGQEDRFPVPPSHSMGHDTRCPGVAQCSLYYNKCLLQLSL